MIVKNEAELQKFAQRLVRRLEWPFCLELIGDVGAGKTSLVKSLVAAFGGRDQVTSPSFTLNNRYDLPGERVLSHYDFYRLLEEELIMNQELKEDLADPSTSVVIEWGQTAAKVLPKRRHRLQIAYTADGSRELSEL